MIRSLCFLILPALALLLAGCGSDITPEERRADEAYAFARDILGRGEYIRGRNQLLGALTLERNLGRTARIGEQLRLLAGVYAEAAAFDSALYYYHQALENFRGLADRRAVRGITMEIARLHHLMGEERKAYGLLTEALRLARVFNDEEGARDLQWAMLPVTRALDESEETDKIVQDLLQVYTAAENVGQQAGVYFQAGLARAERNDHQGAIQNLLSAFTLAGQAQDSTLATTALLRLGMQYQVGGSLQEAFQCYTDALRRVDRLRAGHGLRFELLVRVGNAYLRARQPGEAARFYRAALSSASALGNKMGEGYITILLGHCERDQEAAARSFRSAHDLFTSIAYAPGAAYAMRSLAAVAWRDNRLSDAMQQYRDAVALSDAWLSRPSQDDLYAECERASLGSSGEPAYDDIISLLLQTGRAQEAFRYIERKNGTEICRVLGSLAPQTADAGLNDVLRGAYAARGRRIGAEQQLAALLLEAQRHAEAIGEVRRVLEESGRALADRAASVNRQNRALAGAVLPAAADLAEVQQALPPATTLVMYAPTGRTLYTLMAGRNRFAVQPAAIERDQLLAAAREYNQLLLLHEAHADSAQALQAARRSGELSDLLYGAFIRPIERELGSRGEVYIVLPYDLPCVPLHTLRRSSPRRSPYAVEHIFFRYLPQAHALLVPRASNGNVARSVVALGHPGLTSWDVEYEVRDIRAFFKEARLYFGQQASLATLQKEQGELLSLAVDTRFHAAAPGNSALFLSDPNDGAIMRRIPLGELTSISRFAVIQVSALAPDRSTIHPAEPILFSGSTRAPVVMNSYVPSRKTKKFFGEMFYTALLSGLPADAAVRQAQLEMIRQPEYSAPSAWGAFFYWGR